MQRPEGYPSRLFHSVRLYLAPGVGRWYGRLDSLVDTTVQCRRLRDKVLGEFVGTICVFGWRVDEAEARHGVECVLYHVSVGISATL
jgi:hypothetical protein